MEEMMMQSDNFQVSRTEVRVPTLLIGIGGVGGRIVSSVYDQLTLDDRSVVKMLVLDTNINDLFDVKKRGIDCVQTSKDIKVSSYLSSNPAYYDWFPNNPLISSKSLIDGAGQIRAVSRLGGLASEQAGEMDTIKKALDALKTEKGDDAKKSVKIMIVGSISGGTGSGLGIQLPYYIRSLFGTDTEVLIRGLFLCADVVEEKQHTPNSKKAVYVNEYAFIRELNAFYKAQLVPKEEIKISVEHYNPIRSINDPPYVENKNSVPYDFMFLVEKNSNRDSNLGGLAIYESKAAKIVRSQLFSPVSGGQFSAEDNLIIARVEENGMNGYCSAGYSSAIYPRKDVERYCTLKYAAESVSDLWLHLDKEFKKANAEQLKLMKTTPSLKPLKARPFYMEQFERNTDPNNREALYYISRLAKEIKCNEYDENGEVIGSRPYADVMLENIYAYLGEELAALGLKQLKEECSVDVTKFDDYASAAANARKILKKIDAFAEASREKVGEASVVCAGKILPTVYTEENKADCPHSIYDSFKNCHPLTVRYLIYVLIDLLEKCKEEFDVSLGGKKGDGLDRDFYPKTERKENIIEAIGMAKPSKFRSAVNQLLFPNSNMNSKEYEEIIENFAEAVAEERDYIEKIARASLFSDVFGIVLERLEVLANVYEEFFDEMDTLVSEFETERKNLSKKYTGKEKRTVDGEIYVCADEACLEAIDYDVRSNVVSDPTEFSADAKKKLFAELFTVAEKRIDAANNINSVVGREKTMKEIFEDGVLTTLNEELFKTGKKYTDIGILRAIEREFEAHNAGRNITEADKYDYLQKIFKTISILATPYLSYTAYNGKEIPLAVSYGINTSVICKYFSTDEKELKKSQVENLFRQTEVESNSPIVADSFSQNELICYKAVYDLNVENVNRYRDGQHPCKCYTERLRNVTDQTFKIDSAPDSFLSIVHPHLDKKWNSRAYMPMLIDATDEREGKFVNLSFLLSLAIGACKYALDYDKGKCWRYYTDNSVSSVYVNREDVIEGSGLEDLLDGFNYNEVVRKDVLERVLEMQVRTEKNEPLTGTTTATILKHPLIEKLCKVEEFIDGSRKSITTVYDIIYTVYCKTRDIKLAKELISAFAGFIADYCYGMSCRKAVTAKELMESTVEKIQTSSKNYDASKTGAPDLWIAWNGILRSENFQNNLDYLELREYLVTM